MTSKSAKSYSKINLFLNVDAQRRDGYNEISTLFVPLSEPFDRITIDFSSGNGLSVRSASNSVPDGEANICYKAALEYASRAGIEPCWHIAVEKNIPVAAGMGGGSGNAATVLKLLQAEYNALTEKELHDVALYCGADVPFFLTSAPALASGIGEKISPLDFDLPDWHLLLAAPGFPVSAGWAYRQVKPENKLRDKEGLEKLLRALKAADLNAVSSSLKNDLANALFDKFPLLRLLRSDILQAGAGAAQITGSGPTLFGLFESAETRDCARESLQKKYSAVRFIAGQMKK